MDRQLFNGLLAVAAVSADSGLLVVNRFILSSGTYKFPFPVTTSLIQNVISFILIIFVERLTSLLLCCLTPRESVISLDADQESLLRQDEKLQPHPAEVPRRRSPLRRTPVHQRLRHVFWRIIPVAAVYFAKIVLGNVYMTRLPLTTYTLVRIAAIPLSLILNVSLTGDSHSALGTCCLTVATLSVILAMMPLYDLNVVVLLQGFLLSMSDALFPIVLVNTYDGRFQKRTSQDSVADEDRERFGSSSLLLRMQQACGKFWSILRHISFVSTALLALHVFASGELQSIQENCYVLDVGTLRWLLATGGILNGTVLILMALLAIAASPVTTTFLAAPMNAFQLAIFMYTGFNSYRWIGLSVCWALGLAFIFLPTKDHTSSTTAATRKSYSFARNTIIIVSLCGALSGLNMLQRGSTGSLSIEASTCQNGSSVGSKVPWTTKLNYTSALHDDYLGARPHVDTIANLTYLVEKCREIEEGGGVDDVVNCLSILEHGENEYFYIPKETLNNRTSDLSAEVDTPALSIPNEETLVNDPASAAAGQTNSSSYFGTCVGPVIPFHVYWTGPATWRVELFIKAYLYTQNLPCSRLWLWLDSDLDATAVQRMLCEDRTFQRFRPLVTRGDIVLKSWTFPDRVPLARESAGNASAPEILPSMLTEDGEIILANGLVQDADGRQWLNLKPPQASLAPVQVSDAVRFILLHLYGGVYCDMDVLLLRDMRPLLLPDPSSGPRAFAEQWVERCAPYDYNTAVIALPANSSLSSYLLRGGVRMGMNFHPRVMGRMLWNDGRGQELKMLHNAVFDPLVTNLRREGTGTCTVPCHKNFESAFMGEVEEKENEWSNYNAEVVGGSEPGGSMGNRTLGNFFRGAWAYHIHNQHVERGFPWLMAKSLAEMVIAQYSRCSNKADRVAQWWKFPEPSSWMEVVTQAQDGFFDGFRTNAYGEMWEGPVVEGYDREKW